MKSTLTISKIALSAGLLLAFFAVFAFSVEASSVIRTGDTVSVSEDQFIEGDFYSAAGRLNISGEVLEDVTAIAGQVTVNGSVGADATLLGGSVDVYGTIGDDVRIISGEVKLAEPIMGDVLIIGGVVEILSTASIAGDLILLAGQVEVNGSVGGDILGRAEELRIDGSVGGNMDVTVFNLTFGDNANVQGSVEYVSRNLAVQALNSTIAGDLSRSDPILPESEMSVRSTLLPVLVLLFSVLSWYLISRKSLSLVTQRALTKSLRPIVFGALAILVTPLAIIILSVSMLGLFVGVALFFAYGLLIVLSLIGVSAVIGQLLMKLFNQPSAKLSLITVVVGVVGVTLLMLLPILGEVVLIVFGILTLGAMIDLLLRPKVQ